MNKHITARALLDFAGREYRSRAERRWASEGQILIAELFHTPVEVTLYEPMSFSVPGGRYTPDFLHILSTGEQVFVEIKGSRRQTNYRDARSKLRAAAEVYPYFHWVEALAPSRNTGWKLEQIGQPSQTDNPLRNAKKATKSDE
ncbi:MAG: hypothetical protein KF821_01775 [Anaerolineales bacterium]|nr:hypothetical protein [Anaerolineales bacterium]